MDLGEQFLFVFAPTDLLSVEVFLDNPLQAEEDWYTYFSLASVWLSRLFDNEISSYAEALLV